MDYIAADDPEAAERSAFDKLMPNYLPIHQIKFPDNARLRWFNLFAKEVWAIEQLA